jgi:hypothetical protein
MVKETGRGRRLVSQRLGESDEFAVGESPSFLEIHWEGVRFFRGTGVQSASAAGQPAEADGL